MKLKQIGILAILLLSLSLMSFGVLGAVEDIPNITSYTKNCYTDGFIGTGVSDLGTNASLSYGTSSNYGLANGTITSATNKTSHSFSGDNILLPNKTYFFNLTVFSFTNNTALDSEKFNCTTYPNLTVTSSLSCGDHRAEFTITSNGGANGTVKYGDDSSLAVGTTNVVSNSTKLVFGTISLSKNTQYFFNYTVWRFGDPYYNVGNSLLTNCTTYNPLLESDTLAGLPSAGEQMGGFLTGIQGGYFNFLLVISIIGMVIMVLGVIVLGIKGKFQEM